MSRSTWLLLFLGLALAGGVLFAPDLQRVLSGPALKPIVAQLGLAPLVARLGAPEPQSPAEPASATRPEPASVAGEGMVATYPGERLMLTAEVSGRVVEVAVVEGQAVAVGQVLARFDGDELGAQIQVERARAQEARAERLHAIRELKRRKTLTRSGAMPEQRTDEAQRDRDVADAQQQVALARIQQLEARNRKMTITSPIAGVVILRVANEGEGVHEGSPLFEIANTGRLRVDAEVDEADAGRIAVGARVVITAEGYTGQEWKGSVEEIGPAVTIRRLKPADPGRPTNTRIVPVKVALDEPIPLRLGTSVEIRVHEQRNAPSASR